MKINIAVDTETGGAGELECRSHALLSIGAYFKIPDGSAPLTFHQLIIPPAHLKIEPGAVAVNGYDPEVWRMGGAVAEEVAIIRFLNWLGMAKAVFHNGKVPLVAHNAGHDRGFLTAAFDRYGLLDSLEGDSGLTSRRWRCSCALMGSLQDAGILPPEGGVSLDNMTALRLGLPRDEVKRMRAVHSADVDAGLCWLGYEWMMRPLRVVQGSLFEVEGRAA